MVTRTRVVVTLILVFIVLISAWSRLRHVEESDHEPQRIRLDEHPAFKVSPLGRG